MLKKLFEESMNKTKREILLDNLYISDDIGYEIYDEDEEMIILIVEAFDRLYISLRSDSIDIPNRCWIDADQSIYVASGQDDPFLPVLDGSYWYCGDETYKIGEWTEKDTQNYSRMASYFNEDIQQYQNIFSHEHMMCIPKVNYYTVTEETKKIIWDKFGDKIKESIRVLYDD